MNKKLMNNNDLILMRNISSGLSSAQGGLNMFIRIIKAFTTISKGSLLVIFPHLLFAATIIKYLFSALVTAYFEDASILTRIIKISCYTLIMATSIAAIIVSSPFISLASRCLTAAYRLWDTAVAIYDRLTSTSEDENTIRKLNGDIAERTHSFILAGISILGFCLALVNPAVGTGILIGLAVYLLLDKIPVANTTLNPFRWLANKIFDHPFSRVKEVDEKPAPANLKTTHAHLHKKIPAEKKEHEIAPLSKALPTSKASAVKTTYPYRLLPPPRFKPTTPAKQPHSALSLSLS